MRTLRRINSNVDSEITLVGQKRASEWRTREGEKERKKMGECENALDRDM